MPKKKPSTSTDLVPIGPRQVVSNAATKTERGKRPEKATTTRALVLRSAARGTGEIALVSRMTGREKLDLLAGSASLIICCSSRFIILAASLN